MKKINLEEILEEQIGIYIEDKNSMIRYEDAVLAMKEACKQVLELAAENAANTWTTHGSENGEWVIKGEFNNPEEALALANKLNDEQNIFYYDYNRKDSKQSILNTINQVKWKN